MAMGGGEGEGFDVINDGGLAHNPEAAMKGGLLRGSALAFDRFQHGGSSPRCISAGVTTSVISKL